MPTRCRPRCVTPVLRVLATTVDGEVSLDDADLVRADGVAVRA